GNLINSHPGNQQYRALVDAYTEQYANASSKKEKRAIAMQIYAEMEKLVPPVRFLVEGPSMTDTAAAVVDAAPPHDIKDSSSKVGSSSSRVNLALLNKSWLRVEPEKVLVKILHRLRERVQDQEILSTAAADINPDIAVHPIQDVFQASMPTAEDWKLLNHQLQFSGIETSGTQGTMEQGMKSSDLSKYVKESGFDVVADWLSQSRTLDLEPDSSQPLREYTLRHWIMSSASSALCVALKLTECLIEAEKDDQSGHVNPIPLASIAPDNVMIRAKVGSEVELSDDTQETIEYAWIMSFVGDDLATGEVMARLVALGKVMYELFSSKELIMEDNITDIPTMVSMHSIDLRNESKSSDQRAQKKSYWRSDQAGDEISMNIFASLAVHGVPWSLCALVKNLIECRHGAFCADDAYSSLADLQADLQLMLDNP
ncbi:hypothetical protein ACHAXH_000109, partial [Discostella pseudostelligera]